MEGGLGTTRMGSRSSTRHGPASVFQGKVRRWRKSWAPVPSPSPSASASRVLLYKWTPVSLPNNGTKESTPEEPTPSKRLRFLPVSVVLEQRKEEEARRAEEAEATLGAQTEASTDQNATDTIGGAIATEPLKDSTLDENLEAERTGDPPTGSVDEGHDEGQDEGQHGLETGDYIGQDEGQASREEPAASLEGDSSAPPEPGSPLMDVDQP